MCVSIATIDVTELRIRNFAPIVVKSEETDGSYTSIIASCAGIGETCAATFVICGTTVVMRAETKKDRPTGYRSTSKAS